MPEVWPWPPHIGPHGEILDINPNNRFGIESMIKVDTEPIGAQSLLRALNIARPIEPSASDEN